MSSPMMRVLRVLARLKLIWLHRIKVFDGQFPILAQLGNFPVMMRKQAMNPVHPCLRIPCDHSGFAGLITAV